jgi:hypothetical protein
MQRGRDTDWMVRGRKTQPSCQTPNLLQPEKARVRAAGVSPVPERGTTLTEVKVSKCKLSEEGSAIPQTVGL